MLHWRNTDRIWKLVLRPRLRRRHALARVCGRRRSSGLLGIRPVLVLLGWSLRRRCSRYVYARPLLVNRSSRWRRRCRAFLRDPDFGLNRLKNFFLAESLESVDTCLCLTGTGAGGGGGIGDWARDEGVFSNSESWDIDRSRGVGWTRGGAGVDWWPDAGIRGG